MKNFKCLETFEARKEFIKNLFESSEVKNNLHIPELKKLVDDFCQFPRFIAEYSNQEIEHAHFYSWFNIMILRNYENKTIQDLYYIHELKHITTLQYDSRMMFDDWKNKMIQNELESALFSEVQIYDLVKGLRSKSFNFPIWYDEVPEEVRRDSEQLSKHRKSSMKSPKTEVEKTLFRYQMSNDNWSEVWRVNYQTVEKHMEKFYKTQDVSEFIQDFKIVPDSEQIIFESEAKKFTASYLQLKKETNT